MRYSLQEDLALKDHHNQQPKNEEVVAEMNLILATPHFSASPEISKLFEYLVKKRLSGIASPNEFKRSVIAVELFAKGGDSNAETRVGVYASRLRRALRDYYATKEGSMRQVRINIEHAYVPEFTKAGLTTSASSEANLQEQYERISLPGYAYDDVRGQLTIYAPLPAPTPSFLSRQSILMGLDTWGQLLEIYQATTGASLPYWPPHGNMIEEKDIRPLQLTRSIPLALALRVASLLPLSLESWPSEVSATLSFIGFTIRHMPDYISDYDLRLLFPNTEQKCVAFPGKGPVPIGERPTLVDTLLDSTNYFAQRPLNSHAARKSLMDPWYEHFNTWFRTSLGSVHHYLKHFDDKLAKTPKLNPTAEEFYAYLLRLKDT